MYIIYIIYYNKEGYIIIIYFILLYNIVYIIYKKHVIFMRSKY